MLRWLSLLLGASCASALLGCEVLIGDECTTASECSQEEPRLCLTQALEGYPGGYCTVFNCDPGTCPGEAVCVGYRASLSDTAECGGVFAETRLQRTFCMRSCNDGSDCRSGYACLDLGESNPWSAEVLESDGRNTKVCALAYSGPEIPEDRSSDVCRNDPGAVPLPSAAPLDAGVDGVDASPPAEGVDASPPAEGVDASSPAEGVDASSVSGPEDAGGQRSDASLPADASVDAAR